MLLAACSCDRVPALLFTRPFSAQRRWNSGGEIQIIGPPSPNDLDQWSLKSGWSETQDGASDVENQTLPSNMELLCHEGILSFHLDGEDVFLSITQCAKEMIWREASIEDRILLWLDLLRLTIHAFPDPYAECSWRRVQWCCNEIVTSTIIPFLSVLEWDILQTLAPRQVQKLCLIHSNI